MKVASKLGNLIPTGIMTKFIVNAGVNRDVLRSIIIKQYQEVCKREIKKAHKKSKEITVNDLTKAITDNKDFSELCRQLELDIEFWEGLTENLMNNKTNRS